ncbi:MAG: DEAD/DEAH box helicase [Negativicoccus succinicivorans]|nr:DEAD/DEAH box helicase [Negativicoccus succinicivorans]
MLEEFINLKISKPIITALNEMGFEEPTPIQREAIPIALSGRDMIGQAQTGTGKTAAFGIPMLERVPAKGEGPFALVLAPTRELAIQSAEEINRLAQHLPHWALPIYGGQDMGRQLRSLNKRPPIIVATPGRLMDHMERGTISLDNIQLVVLDEADEMLNMGFIDDINKIVSATPEERQTLLFSATMPNAIRELADKFLTEPEHVTMKMKEVTIDLIDQDYIEVPERQKFDVLCRLLDMQDPTLAIIFGRTKRRVDEVTEALKKRGYTAEGLHGDLSQAKRDKVMRQFRENTIDLLVATDVAARGLDISGVTHVYNYDMPQDPESYVHRVGRTGRAGQAGLATTFVVPREMEHLRAIEHLIRRRIARRAIPSLSQVIESNRKNALTNLVRTAEQDNLDGFHASAEELLRELDSVTLVAAAIKLLTEEPDTTPVNITAERPLARKKGNFAHRGPRSGQNQRSGGKRNFSRGKRRERSDRNDRNDRNDRGYQSTSRKGGKKKKFTSGFEPYFRD